MGVRLRYSHNSMSDTETEAPGVGSVPQNVA